MRRIILGLALLLLTNSQIWAQSITVFTGPDFRGEQQTFDREAPRLRDAGWNDRIASVRVQAGEWQLCRRESFTECIAVSRDVSNLAVWGMDYAVNSLRPMRGGQMPSIPGTPSITVFEGAGFRGQERSFQGSIPRLRNQGWSDRIGSIMVGAGQWEICAEENFRECVTISVDQADLTKQRLDYRIRSIRPLVQQAPEPPSSTGLPAQLTREQSEYLAERLYRAILGREADDEGLQNAASEIQFGNLDRLVQTLTYSNEFGDARLNFEQLLDQLYQGLLGRSPDPAAKAHLARMQQRGGYIEVVKTILNSEEFVRSLPQ